MTPSLVQEYLHSSDEELDLSKPLILMGLNSSRQVENTHSE
jgi:aryl carrier-like protein